MICVILTQYKFSKQDCFGILTKKNLKFSDFCNFNTIFFPYFCIFDTRLFRRTLHHWTLTSISISSISAVYQDDPIQAMLAMKKEIQACKDPIQRDQQPAKGACDSTGCVAVKATPEEPEFLFCCFKQCQVIRKNSDETLKEAFKLCFIGA